MFFRYQPKLDHIVLPEPYLIERERTADAIQWSNGQNVAFRVSLGSMLPWRFDLTQLEAARRHFEAESQQLKGAMLELDVRRIAGVETLVGIFKYRSPIPKHMGMYYVGIVWLPFRDFLFRVNIEALERGTTGAREAAVAMIEPPPARQQPPEPVLVSSMEELFANMRESPLGRIPPDEAKWDSLIPDHPLSLVRAALRRFESGARFDSKLAKQRPHRA